MQTVCFSDGTTAEVTNVRGTDTRTFNFPIKDMGLWSEIWKGNQTFRFEGDARNFQVFQHNGANEVTVKVVNERRR